MIYHFKKQFLLGLMICGSVAIANAQEEADDILGKWEGRNGTVEISKVDDKYIGHPIDSDGTKDEDVEMLSVTYGSDNWTGQLYIQQRDTHADVECKLDDEGNLVLNVSMGFMKREVTWNRLNE